MNQPNETLSKSGKVRLKIHFRDNLIVDRDHPCLENLPANKKNQLRSENSEDALSWNVFRSLHHIKKDMWLPQLAHKALGKRLDAIEYTKIKLWWDVPHPASLCEKDTEVDIMLENPNWVWCIEAKYTSKVKEGTTHDKKRNQILRNIDVGSFYAKPRKFYFSLLCLDAKFAAKHTGKIKQYQNQSILRKKLSHRTDDLSNIDGIGVFYWSDIARILAAIPSSPHAKKAVEWLAKKGIA